MREIEPHWGETALAFLTNFGAIFLTGVVGLLASWREWFDPQNGRLNKCEAAGDLAALATVTFMVMGLLALLSVWVGWDLTDMLIGVATMATLQYIGQRRLRKAIRDWLDARIHKERGGAP